MQGTMPAGARRRGRPRTAWIDNIKTWTGLSVEESIRMPEDRDKWRKYVYGVYAVLPEGKGKGKGKCVYSLLTNEQQKLLHYTECNYRCNSRDNNFHFHSTLEHFILHHAS